MGELPLYLSAAAFLCSAFAAVTALRSVPARLIGTVEALESEVTREKLARAELTGEMEALEARWSTARENLEGLIEELRDQAQRIDKKRRAVSQAERRQRGENDAPSFDPTNPDAVYAEARRRGLV